LLLQETPASGDWYRVDVYEAIDAQTQQTAGIRMAAARAIGERWAVAMAVISMVPSSSLDFSLGTLLPTVTPPDEIDRVFNGSIKDPGYCRGAITSAIYTR
jgi:hypothetical protein